MRHFPDSEELIAAIIHRIEESNNPFCAVWLRGPSSNLAYLCARQLSNQLAASFFFDTKYHSDDTSKFFLTIAYQLALLFPLYDTLLRAQLRLNPSLVSKCLESQFYQLIVHSFRQLRSQDIQVGDRGLIFLNGLDHPCQNSRDRSEILRLIGKSGRELPFRWVIFSAPGLVDRPLEPTIISVESSDLFSGTYKGWKLVVAFSRVDEIWANLPHMGQKLTFFSLSVCVTASLFD